MAHGLFSGCGGKRLGWVGKGLVTVLARELTNSFYLGRDIPLLWVSAPSQVKAGQVYSRDSRARLQRKVKELPDGDREWGGPRGALSTRASRSGNSGRSTAVGR